MRGSGCTLVTTPAPPLGVGEGVAVGPSEFEPVPLVEDEPEFESGASVPGAQPASARAIATAAARVARGI